MMSKVHLDQALTDIKNIKLTQIEETLYAIAKTKWHITTHDGYPSCNGKLPPLREEYSYGYFYNGTPSEFHTSLYKWHRILIERGEIEEYIEIELYGELLNMKGER